MQAYKINFLLKLLLLTVLLMGFGHQITLAQDGQALFKANCASCHNLYKRGTGPALLGAVDRWDGNTEEMTAFIKNPQGYAGAGRPKSAYVKTLYDEYKTWMTAFGNLKDPEIGAILEYIKKAPATPPGQVAQGPGSATGEKDTTSIPASGIYVGLLVLVGLLLIVTLALVLVIAVLIQANKAKEEGSPLTWQATVSTIKNFFKHPAVSTSLVILLVLGGFNQLVTFTRGIGLHKGYMPAQPIAFSHKLHAGENQIACQYCHTGVERGKQATIPSTNICMNCHKHIEEGPKYGKTEIGKIKKSAETGVPIEWVKIHNLPDLVYFNHAQHVKVAGLECNACHGDLKKGIKVEEMEEVYQVHDLSMGWCINCHREKNVDLNQSDYYRTVHAKLRDDIEKGILDKSKITVEKLGGLECARCHY